jgi:ribonuclease HI
VRRQAPVVNIDENAVNVFTDGSSLSAPRRGGIGIHIVVVDADGNEVEHDHPMPGRAGGTNQEMELLACVEALRLVGGRHSPVDLASYSKVIIYTDSMYVAENYANAKYTWPRTRWYTKDGDPVVNAKLWKDLVKAADKLGKRFEIQWHQGHSSKNPHNKAADKLAKASAQGHLEQPVRVSRVRRKLTTKSTDVGSIRTEGQRLRLRVVAESWLPVQKMHRYKCEVMSEDSTYFGNIDNLSSHIILNVGHTYDVQLSDGPTARRITEMYGEVEASPYDEHAGPQQDPPAWT